MLVTTQVTTEIGCVIVATSINYSGVILSANHVSNHDAIPKSLPEMTYSSILYILYLELIILFYRDRGDTRTHIRESAHTKSLIKKMTSVRKIFDIWLCQSNIND